MISETSKLFCGNNYQCTLRQVVSGSVSHEISNYTCVRVCPYSVKLTVREEVNYDPYLEHTSAPPLVVQPSMSSPSKSLQNQHPQSAKPVQRYHPYVHTPNNPASYPRSTDANDQGHLVSQSGHRGPHERAAEVFLDEIETSLGPPIVPKPEPVDSVLPFVRHLHSIQ